MQFLLTTMLFVSVLCAAVYAGPDRDELVARWSAVLGEPVDLQDDEVLFNAISVVGPQKAEALTPFDGLERSEGLVRSSQSWIHRFLKEGYRPDLGALQPLSVYFTLGNEPSLLIYEWSANDVDFHMTESGNAVLLRISPSEPAGGEEGDPQSPLTMLYQCVDTGYESEKAFAEAFQINDPIVEGKAFRGPDWVSPGLNMDWRKLITGFRVDDAMYVLLFKSTGGGAAGTIEYRPRWLEGNVTRRNESGDGPDRPSATQPSTQPAVDESSADEVGAS